MFIIVSLDHESIHLNYNEFNTLEEAKKYAEDELCENKVILLEGKILDVYT